MFKTLCHLVIPFVLARGVANAQDKQPTAPPVVPKITSKPADAIALSAGEIKLGDHLIVPGKRIGPIALGATRKEVEAILGVPGATVKMEDDSNYSTWRWEKQPKEKGHADFFMLIFQKDRVVQIETNARDFALPNGLSIQSPAADWARLWNNHPERRTVMMSIVGTPMHLTWKQVGFALEVPWESRAPGDLPIQSMIVLPKNQLAKTTFSLLRDLKLVKPQSATK